MATNTESPEAIAERLLPCDDARACAHDLHACPQTFRPAVAAALQAERERALEEACKVVCKHCRNPLFTVAYESSHDSWTHRMEGRAANCYADPIRRALAQKGGGV